MNSEEIKDNGSSAISANIGCAGLSIPKAYDAHFPMTGSHLERYAARFTCVEINSSFYRSHRYQTYVRWATSVPDSFRFAVKVPKSITHEHRLKEVATLLDPFLEEVIGLGDKLGPLLVQLPPSLQFNAVVADVFFSTLREKFGGQVVCEPRHATWFDTQANDLLTAFKIARVVADPAPIPQAKVLGGWDGLRYYRLHGSPTIYRSDYSPEFLENLVASLKDDFRESRPVWCIFDNTAEGAATGNALELIERLEATRVTMGDGQ